MDNEAMRTALQAEQCLQEAVIEEFRHKAKLGQYVVVQRDGKPCKIPAEEALREAEAAMRERKASQDTESAD